MYWGTNCLIAKSWATLLSLQPAWPYPGRLKTSGSSLGAVVLSHSQPPSLSPEALIPVSSPELLQSLMLISALRRSEAFQLGLCRFLKDKSWVNAGPCFPPKCNSIIWCSEIEEWAGHRRSRARRAVALGSALLFNVLPPGSCSVCRLLICLTWKVLKFGTQALTWCWQAMLLYAHVSSVPVCMPVSKQTYLFL